MYQIKILILYGTFSFQINFLRKLLLSFTKSIYIDLTEKVPETWNFQRNISASWLSMTAINCYTNCSSTFIYLELAFVEATFQRNTR
jgi:hypothetical protein